jgi:hypothetical protein
MADKDASPDELLTRTGRKRRDAVQELHKGDVVEVLHRAALEHYTSGPPTLIAITIAMGWLLLDICAAHGHIHRVVRRGRQARLPHLPLAG